MPQVSPHRPAGRRPLLLLAAAAALLVGCPGPDTTLEGSLGEVIDLTFTDVDVAITDWAVIVSYWRLHGETEEEGRDVVFKLVAYQTPAEVVPGQDISLDPAEDGTARASCTRAVGEDPIRNYAAIKTGRLTLDAIPALDQPVSGEFRVTLDEGGDAGKGRTAFGRFKVLKVAPGN